MMIGSIRTDRQRQTVAINDSHDLHALAATRRTDFRTATLRTGKRRVDEALALIDLASVAQLVRQLRQYLAQNLALAPLLETPMDRLVVRIALRQHVPLRTGIENPEHRFQHRARRNRSPTRATIRDVLLGKMLSDVLPLVISQVQHERDCRYAKSGCQ